jgi:hypothetical protein
MTTTTPQRFPCTSDGSVVQGRRRMRGFLLTLALFTFAVAVVAVWVDRLMPAALAAGAGSLALFARRMSADLDPVWFDLEGDQLKVQMKRQHQFVALAGSTLRRLEAAELAHLTNLATAAGITAGTGGFESHMLGEFDLYATNLANAVFIQHEETATIVTPDDPEAFMIATRDAIAAGRQIT